MLKAFTVFKGLMFVYQLISVQ